MSAPTVDISNIDTSNVSANRNTDVYKKQVITSCQNMFILAQHSLEKNPHLSKVIIMEHPPRFDNHIVDPNSLKPNLARLANVTLGQLFLNSPFKDKIVIGRHSLESPGAGPAHDARYVNRSGRSDGVHFWGVKGREVYTNSVNTILMSALPNSRAGTAQGGCQDQSGKKFKTHVPTNNRFSVFNSNKGNC